MPKVSAGVRAYCHACWREGFNQWQTTDGTGAIVAILISGITGAVVQSWTQSSSTTALATLGTLFVVLAPYRLWTKAQRRIAELEEQIAKRLRLTDWRARDVGNDEVRFEVQVENDSDSDETRAIVTMTALYHEDTGQDVPLDLAMPLQMLPADHPNDGTSGRFNLDGRSKRWIRVLTAKKPELHINHGVSHEGARAVKHGNYIVELEVTPNGERKKFRVSSNGVRTIVPV